jgi:hypothetical protein
VQVFPFIKEPTKTGSGPAPKSIFSAITSSNQPLIMGTGANQWSLRTTRATWSNSSKQTSASNKDPIHPKEGLSAPKTADYAKNGPAVIVFVIGGMTYSEMRSIYEVMHDQKRDIYIGSSLRRRKSCAHFNLGSSHVWSPIQFVENLRDLELGAPKRPALPVSPAKDDPKSTEDKKEKKSFFKKK